jgi:ATP-binding cassette subfamily C protein
MEGMISHVGAYGMLAMMRVKFFESVARLAPAYMVGRNTGDIVSIAVSDIETIEFFFAHLLGPVLTIIALPLTTMIVAWHYSPRYVGVMLPIYVMISVILPLISMKAGRGIGVRYREALSRVKSLVLESVYGIRDIEIFGIGGERLKLVREANNRVNRASHGLTLHKQVTSSTPNFFVYLTRIMIIVVSTALAAEGKGDPAGTVVLSMVAIASFASTFSLTSVITNLLQTYASAERLFTLEDAEPPAKEPEDPVEIGPIETIEFRNVRFRYEEGRPDVLKGFSLKVNKGDRIGIVGESGVGKSTVFRLIMRFWDPVGGEILINGVPSTKISMRELHRRIAVLEQDTFLFDDSIAANIAFGRPDASMEEIVAAAKGAGIHDFIQTLPDGYETQMGQMGSRLSGGERQRVGIARCLLARPDVIIMDEPTSSLDVFREKELIRTLREQYAGKTLMIISHRRSTLTDCRRIVRIEDGRAVEEQPPQSGDPVAQVAK